MKSYRIPWYKKIWFRFIAYSLPIFIILVLIGIVSGIFVCSYHITKEIEEKGLKNIVNEIWYGKENQ
jgi:hypothetical protein